MWYTSYILLYTVTYISENEFSCTVFIYPFPYDCYWLKTICQPNENATCVLTFRVCITTTIIINHRRFLYKSDKSILWPIIQIGNRLIWLKIFTLNMITIISGVWKAVSELHLKNLGFRHNPDKKMIGFCRIYRFQINTRIANRQNY